MTSWGGHVRWSAAADLVPGKVFTHDGGREALAKFNGEKGGIGNAVMFVQKGEG